ncbi:MAG: Choline kinase, partial [Blastococcus sp.]|nr:Choline kinase [Blastococcus sp.]
MRTSDRVLTNAVRGRSSAGRATRLHAAQVPAQVVILAAGMGTRLGRSAP